MTALNGRAITRSFRGTRIPSPHRFTPVVRVSPKRYLREARLERARTLLMTSGAHANEVARLVGFDSPAHFTRELKRRLGVTPSHYLRARSG